MHMDASSNRHGESVVNVSRRKFLFTALSLASLAVTAPLAIVHATGDDAGLNAFMQVSRLISVKATQVVTGAALYLALKQSDQDFDIRLNMLTRQMVATPGITTEALAENLDRTGQTDLRNTLNKMVSAWYLGVVGFKTYAYEGALMFGVVDDVLCPPSYVRGAPLYWVNSTYLPFD
jgi:hypothetical protein